MVRVPVGRQGFGWAGGIGTDGCCLNHFLDVVEEEVTSRGSRIRAG